MLTGMDLGYALQLLVYWTTVTIILAAIPDKTLIITVDQENEFYMNYNVENWITYKTTSPEFIQKFTSPKIPNTVSLSGVASDVNAHHVIFSDPMKSTLLLVDAQNFTVTFFHIGTSKHVGQLAVDWRGRNVYWTDAGFGWIAMKQLPTSVRHALSTDAGFRVVIDQYLHHPSGIAVHPHKRYLFWSDIGINGQVSKIERSDLAGDDRRVIVYLSLITPHVLTLDLVSERLYWSDSTRGTIEHCDFDGSNRHVFASKPGAGYYSIGVFQNALLYTAVLAGNYIGFISLADQTYGREIVQPVVTAEGLEHMLVYDQASQPRHVNEPCDTADCGHMCINTANDEPTCYCKDGYILDEDNKTCSTEESSLERQLLFTSGNSICAVTVNVVTAMSLVSQTVTKNCNVVPATIGEITKFSLDVASKVIFYTNGSTIFKHRAFSTAFSTALFNQGTARKTIIDMDFDWIKKELYWVLENDGDLHMHTLTDGHTGDTMFIAHVISLSEGAIVNIAVDPHNRIMYYIERRLDDSYKLYGWDIANSDVKLIETTLLNSPTDLAFDRIGNRLVWNDANGHVGYINADGRLETKVVIPSTGKARYAVTVYKKFVLLSTAEDNQWYVIYELDNTVQALTSEINNAYDLHVWDSTLQPDSIDSCEQNNGGCDHVCLPNLDMTACDCQHGFVLESDGSTCIMAESGHPAMVMLDDSNSLYTLLDDGRMSAVQVGPSNSPESMAFDSNRRRLAWVDRATRTVKSMTMGDLSSETAYSRNVAEHGNLAIDSGTGNIYVTSGRLIWIINEGDVVRTLTNRSSVANMVMRRLVVMSSIGKMAWIETINEPSAAAPSSTSGVYMANMDGSGITEVIPQTSAVIQDLAVDFQGGYYLYWCDSYYDLVKRMDVTSRTPQTVYIGRYLNPIAIDVDGEYLFLVPQNSRTIIRLLKDDGTGQFTVLESPLLGILLQIYAIHSVEEPVHQLCGRCNGDCSDLCLPRGEEARVCACSDGDTLLTGDVTTCKSTSTCPEFVDGSLVESLDNCCRNGLGALTCGVTCLDPYTRVGSAPKVKCQSGRWNTTIMGVCELINHEPEPEPLISMTTLIAGCAGGGTFVIIICVLTCVCLRRRKRSQKNRNAHVGQRQGRVSNAYNTSIHRREDNNSRNYPPPPIPAPRLSEAEQADGGEYQDLDESTMMAKKVDLPPLRKSDRYSKFPVARGNEYLDLSDAKSYAAGSDLDPDRPYTVSLNSTSGYEPNGNAGRELLPLPGAGRPYTVGDRRFDSAANIEPDNLRSQGSQPLPDAPEEDQDGYLLSGSVNRPTSRTNSHTDSNLSNGRDYKRDYYHGDGGQVYLPSRENHKSSSVTYSVRDDYNDRTARSWQTDRGSSDGSARGGRSMDEPTYNKRIHRLHRY